ncbi:hypothetical protein BaRGS_00009986 [Batillaria attramentaria]|uniref:AAA+ ATPase domain-containing protein n=1 Tax=Batillaria attramentaria TaxID=370345 RepID=A0ABD0LIT6_9CAEN
MNPAAQALADKAVEHLRTALTHDCKGEFGAALMSYLDGVPLLLEASKDPILGIPMQDLLKAKCKQYLARVQVIRDHMEKGEEVPPNNYVDRRQSSLRELDEDTQEMFRYFSEIPSPVPRLEDVFGPTQCKEFIEKNVILPLKFPGLLDKVAKVKRGILLYGVPGVGKTFLIQAVLASISCPFLRIQSSDLICRFNGLECILKRVQDLFEWAKKNQPCILCFEDLDVLCHPDHSSPDSIASQVREELTARLQSYSAGNQVTVIGSTQKPWYLTGKLVRKFDRRFLLTLPTLEDRIAIFRQKIVDLKLKQDLSEEDFKVVGERTEGFTGADLSCLARDCIMMPVRQIQNATHYKKITVTEEKNGEEESKEMLTPCAPTDSGALEITWEFLNADRVQEPTLTMQEVEICLARCSPSCCEEEIEKMAKWAEEFGQEDI